MAVFYWFFSSIFLVLFGRSLAFAPAHSFSGIFHSIFHLSLDRVWCESVRSSAMSCFLLRSCTQSEAPRRLGTILIWPLADGKHMQCCASFRFLEFDRLGLVSTNKTWSRFALGDFRGLLLPRICMIGLQSTMDLKLNWNVRKMGESLDSVRLQHFIFHDFNRRQLQLPEFSGLKNVHLSFLSERERGVEKHVRKK